MIQDLTFKQLCELVKKDGKQEPELLEAVDRLLGLTLLCAPVVIGPTLAALLPVLAIKDELVKLGKFVFDKVTKKKEDEYVARQERMQLAHGLLIFTAFFDALDSQIPKNLREKIALTAGEKEFLAKSAADQTIEQPKKGSNLIHTKASAAAAMPIAFPHPTESLAEQIAHHAKLWNEMAKGFSEFLQKLALWEGATEEEQSRIVAAISKVPEEAAKRFEAQYFELARKYEDFAVWSNLQEHKGTKKLIGQLSDYVKQYAELSKGSVNSIDIGFKKLHEAVSGIPETLKISHADELVQSLSKHYQARINDPIIENKEEEGKPQLSFPRVCDAFIPQAFRVLRQIGPSKRLEEESTWEAQPRRNDLHAFMLNYLGSPYSSESPLLILGHPGSGKSLLTTVLSARVMSKHFTAIRVPLREVNAESGIVSQIEEAIRHVTNVGVDSWAKLSRAFKNNPPLVILDGYDELLQASGKVFASYLKDVQAFQKSEAEQGRPVRVIVTSRVTLIDKAIVPAGATIVRLLEFDKNQREQWISIWNNANLNYFREAKIEEFALPSEKEAGAEKILSLAEQPLLLLMLALYDSQGNQLRKSKALDRTKLYDSLLRRFVARERGKEKNFNDGSPVEKSKVLNTEMQRLGIAALGMYNRRKVHILSTELNDDLKFFKSERNVAVASGWPLSQADLLLGSFFFVHKSKAQHGSGVPEAQEEAAAFEFLHNTFGEFLTADFVLRRTLSEVETLLAYQSNEALREELEKRLNSADGFSREWFASLVYTPLFTRPVVLEMMREWIGHVLVEKKLEKQKFVSSLETIILNQIRRVLTKREMPSIIRGETVQEGYRAPFGDHPLLGHIAIYSINLIFLRLIVSSEPFTFDESQIAIHEDGARPWERLTHIWRSWFALDNLNGVTAVMLASRQEHKITIRSKKQFQVTESRDRLESCRNVANSLGDNILSGLAGFLLFEPAHGDPRNLDDIRKRLASEKIDLEVQVATKQLLLMERHIPEVSGQEFVKAATWALETALRGDNREELEHICLSFLRGIRSLKWSEAVRRAVGWDIVSPAAAVEITRRNPRAGLSLWQAMSKLLSSKGYFEQWLSHFGVELFDAALHQLSAAAEEDLDALAAWIQLARDVVQELGREWDKEAPREHLSLRRLADWLFEEVLNPRYSVGLTERSPEIALAWLRLIWELEQVGFSRHPHTFLLSFVDLGYLFDLARRSPEVALAFLQILLKMERDGLVEVFAKPELRKSFVRLLNSRYVFELPRRNPESALEWLQVALDLGGESFVDSVTWASSVFFREGSLERVLSEKPALFAVALRVARVGGSPQLLRQIVESVAAVLRGREARRRILGQLPVSALRDLSWLAERAEDLEVRSALIAFAEEHGLK